MYQVENAFSIDIEWFLSSWQLSSTGTAHILHIFPIFICMKHKRKQFLLQSRGFQTFLSEGHINYYTRVRGPDILRNVIVSRQWTYRKTSIWAPPLFERHL